LREASHVDLGFPFFLFAMGAALPFSLGRKMKRGVSLWLLTGSSLLRGAVELAGYTLVGRVSTSFTVLWKKHKKKRPIAENKRCSLNQQVLSFLFCLSILASN
jgi:predicted acyltransferase